MASGNIKPVRIIEGQRTKLTRVAHGIAYDSKHDVIIGTEPLAASIVFFRGGTVGNTPPIRVIQGPHTLLHAPYEPSVDVVNNELWIADLEAKALYVFPLDGNGDIPPLRIIKGPKAVLGTVSGVAVDPEHNLVVATGYSYNYRPGIFIFDRTANGNVAPKRIIMGPSTGIISVWHVQVADSKIFAVASNFYYIPSYDPGGYKPRGNCDGPMLPFIGPLGFVGVWNESDNGDVPPHGIILGPASELLHPVGIAIDAKHGQVFASDSVRNSVFSYLVPSFF